ADWLALLATPNLEALTMLCAEVRKHVAPSRLTFAQCIDLANATAAPVAELGLAWASDKPVRTDADLAAALRIASAPVPPVRARGSAWCAGLLRAMPEAKPERVRDLCDARFADARAAGLALLDEPRFREELSLWLALTESPYADVRAFVLSHAKAWNDRA